MNILSFIGLNCIIGLYILRVKTSMLLPIQSTKIRRKCEDRDGETVRVTSKIERCLVRWIFN